MFKFIWYWSLNRYNVYLLIKNVTRVMHLNKKNAICVGNAIAVSRPKTKKQVISLNACVKRMVSIFQNRMSNCLQKENAGIIVSYKVVIKLVLGFGSK